MYSIVRTVLLGAALVLPLVLVGCSGTDGGGSGGGGAGGTGDNVAMTIEQLCSRLDECNELVGISVTECIELVSTCVGENLPTSSLQQDWARLVNECQAFATCGIFVDCYSDLTCSFDGGTGGSGGAGGVGPGEYFMKCEFDSTEIVIGLSLEADAPEGLVAGAPSTITTQVRAASKRRTAGGDPQRSRHDRNHADPRHITHRHRAEQLDDDALNSAESRPG